MENIIKNITNYMFVPCKTITDEGVIKCIKVDKIDIKDVGVRENVLVGFVKNLKMEGIDCIINSILMEET